MKILFIQKVKLLAGSEKYFLDIIPELIKKGIEIDFLSVREYKDGNDPILFIDKMRERGVRVIDLTTSFALHPKILFKIRSLVKTNNYDLVHTHLIHADLWGALTQLILRIKINQVSTKHGYEESFINEFGFDHEKLTKNKYYKISRFSEKYILKSFSVSKGIADLFVKSKISTKEKMSIIHHGFSYKNNDENKLTTNFRYSSNQIIIVGRLVGFKGHRFLIKALVNIKKSISDIKLLIVGSGEEEESLRELARKLDLENDIEFLGYKQNVNDYLTSSDLMIIPSVAEGFGLVLLEGFNAKLPLVAFDVPACNEIIDDKVNGRLVKPYNIQQLSTTIVELLGQKKMCLEMGEKGYAKLHEYFTLNRMVDETIQFYKEALLEKEEK